MNIIFTGTSEFAAKYLQFLLDNNINISCVITQPDKPKGRKLKLTPSPVADIAIAKELPLHKPLNISDTAFENEVLKPIDADLMIVVAYGQILKENILNLPKAGCINIHPSKLPYYRGAAPIQRTIFNGETTTAACIIAMDKGLDSGNIIKQEELSIKDNEDFGSLEQRLFEKGAQLLLETINDIKNNNLKSVEQNHQNATYAHKIKKADCVIDITQNASDIHNQVRALSPYPLATLAAKIKKQTMKIKIWETELIEDNSDNTPGTIIKQNKDTLIIKTKKNALSIKTLQLPGKNKVKIADFLRGYKLENDAFKNVI